MEGQRGAVRRIALVGAHGHGRWHLRNIRRLASDHAVELVGVCDPVPLDDDLRHLAGDVPLLPDLTAVLADLRPDVTIVCTPIHTHTELTLRAVRAGSHVLLEKPPAPTLAEYDRLVDGVAASDRSCQVGFQSLGSLAVPVVRQMVSEGAVGDVTGIGGACAWQRTSAYFSRAPWAGRRVVDGVPVVDGALTNPFAHAVVTALAIEGSLGRGSLDEIEVELYRANDIEADDTSTVRMRTSRGTRVVVAATLCAEESRSPYLVVHGTRGRITLFYKEGRVRLQTESQDSEQVYPAVDLLADLVRHLDEPAGPLLVPPESTGAFMEVVEAVRTAPEPVALPLDQRLVVEDGDTTRVVVPGVDEAVRRACEELALLSELGLGWPCHPLEPVEGTARQ